uniref:Uncharacterized protein n=1 Tax=Magallana gigas TaxID=29159 RepID=K1R2R3_MAGGI
MWENILFNDAQLQTGWEINETQRDTFLKCQLCKNNDCSFKSCYDLAASSIFCQTTSDTSQSQETGNVARVHGNLNVLSNHLTAKELLAPHFTIRNCDEAQLPSVEDTQQKSSASDNLALKISLPLILDVDVDGTGSPSLYIWLPATVRPVRAIALVEILLEGRRYWL